MSSTYPESTGIYFLNPSLKSSPAASSIKVMPQRYAEEGYEVAAAGKLFHNEENALYFPEYGGSFGGFGPLPPKRKISHFPGHKLWDWGVFPKRNESMPDVKIAKWASTKLGQNGGSPFFYGVGFYRPHVPQFAPQQWFDKYPMEQLKLPEIKKDDVNDIPPYGFALTRAKHVAPTHQWVEENKQWEPLVRSYLACVSFVDAQVGKVVDALEKSSHATNTYIVFYSDHGFHLGEKERWAKRSLWNDSTRVPMIIVGPGIKKGQVCHKPVQLLDIYPTLLELTKHKADKAHQGHSLVPLLNNPKADWPHMARCSFGPGNYAIISEQHRYIHYNDGSEEFYHSSQDPHEWNNLADDPKFLNLIEKHRAQAPQTFHRILGKGSTGHKAYTAAEKGRNKK